MIVGIILAVVGVVLVGALVSETVLRSARRNATLSLT